jgi:hypothetical protein
VCPEGGARELRSLEVTRKLADMHGGSEDEAARILGGLGRAVRVLPLWSCHTHAICVHPTSLAALAQLSGEAVGMKRKRAEDDASADGGDLSPPALDFWRFFPGAKRLLKGGRGGTLSLHPFIRTDGITASVTMKRRAPASEAGAAQKRGGEFKTPVLDRGAAKPAPGQRLVAVDPGRRDLFMAVSNDPAEKPFSVSTRQYRHNAKTSDAARVTRRAYDLQDASLRPAMQALPCSRAYECWDAYLLAALPILGARLEALRLTCVRRTRFASYMRRDRELDRICKLLCGTSTRTERRALEQRAAQGPGAQPLPTLVAFGAANACSTGFGYAPAPQGRLRHRLAKVHGARVTLIDEFRTSKVCSCCGSLLEKTYKSLKAAAKSQAQKTEAAERKRIAASERSSREPSARSRAPAARSRAPAAPVRAPRRAPRLTTLVYGVRRCRFCEEQTGRPLFWHRDVNAARNIMDVYVSLADTGKRPTPLTRPAAPREARAATRERTPQPIGREPPHGGQQTSRSPEPPEGPAGAAVEDRLPGA